MADQEFERLVQEGMAALERSRERLQSDRDKPPDWEETTPEPLKEAVKHIRSEFKTAAWQLAQQVECGCYMSLHPELATLPRYKGGENLIRSDLRDRWHLQFQHMNEAERFADWVKQYSEFLEKNVAPPFNAFLGIGLANESNVIMQPVEWAKTLTRGLLYSLKFSLPHVIKAMCDEQEQRLEINMQTFDAHCSWVWWRAPSFVYMHPSGNTPYNAETAWRRSDDAEFTEMLLRGLTCKMIDPAWFKLDRLAGEAYVSLASIPRARADGTSPATPAVKQGSTKTLPPKQQDLSEYIEQAQLTERQRECFSLKFEHGCTVKAIAQTLGISRKTVDEHIHAAEKRIGVSRVKNRASKKQAASVRPE
jgi:DNA-directed RNA polymerase specialized sigma24 family protein